VEIEMAFQKGNKVDVEEFKFGQLAPTSADSATVKNWNFETLDPKKDLKRTISPEKIRVERQHETSSGFVIDKDIREHRGLKSQESQDFENRVEAEILKRLEKREKQAYEEGFNAGQADGSTKAYEEAMVEYEQKILIFEDFLETMMQEKSAIIEQSKSEAYGLIKNLTKWIVLKEVENKDYIERLLEKLILEINTKSNLLIRVNKADFENIPQVLENIQTRLGNLTNTRVEIGNELDTRGIILESEVGVIDGSFESQMKSLDKLFENVGLNE
jgi:flagellar assembly protein FliH